MRNRADFENDPLIINAIQRGLIEIHGDRIIYNIHQKTMIKEPLLKMRMMRKLLTAHQMSRPLSPR